MTVYSTIWSNRNTVRLGEMLAISVKLNIRQGQHSHKAPTFLFDNKAHVGSIPINQKLGSHYPQSTLRLAQAKTAPTDTSPNLLRVALNKVLCRDTQSADILTEDHHYSGPHCPDI